MKNTIIKEGELNLGHGIEIPCYILEDTKRVISGRAMQSALMIGDTSDRPENEKSGAELSRFLETKWFKELIASRYELEHFLPITCEKGGKKINGYEATVLVDICDVMLQARKSGLKFNPRQTLMAEQCEILVRSFAKVGIIALVDEATGYQYDRERFELQKILSAYISDEILKWQLTFTDEFYKEVYRLWGLPFIPKYIKNKPSFIGKLTNKYIYEEMPEGVLTKIKDNTPKTEKGNWKYKFHQSLTPEIGREHLKKQIIEVTTLMSVAQSKEQFQSLFKQKYGKEVQLELEFKEQPPTPLKKSGFDALLTQAIEYNPKEKRK